MSTASLIAPPCFHAASYPRSPPPQSSGPGSYTQEHPSRDQDVGSGWGTFCATSGDEQKAMRYNSMMSVRDDLSWASYNEPGATKQEPQSYPGVMKSPLIATTAYYAPINTATTMDGMPTVSPTQMSFDAAHQFDAFPTYQHTDEQLPSSSSDAPTSSTASTVCSPVVSSTKRSLDSLDTPESPERQASASPSAPRGRKRSSVEPGSARAVYLEKNREAARKCRSKQKRQQETLVEKARDSERKNKLLKAEVEVLKCDMRDLMGMVLQHSSCPDRRLSTYVQQEANRIANVASSESNFSESSSDGKSSSPSSTAQ